MTLLGPGDVHVLGVERFTEEDHCEVRYAEGEYAAPEASTTSNNCLERCSFSFLNILLFNFIAGMDSLLLAFVSLILCIDNRS